MPKKNADETKILDSIAVICKNEYWPIAVLLLTYNSVQLNCVKLGENITGLGNIFYSRGLYVRSTERN